MTTIKQKQAAIKTLENGGNVSRSMREVGYSESTINNPSNLTSSKGYRELLYECGLTESLIVQSLVADICSKSGKRLGELSLGAEVLGMRKMAPFIANQINVKETKEKGAHIPTARDYELANLIDEYDRAKIEGKSSIIISIP